MIVIAQEPAFTAAIDRAARRLEFTLFGHWDLPTVARFRAAIAASVARLPALGIRPGDQVALFDTGGFAVQSANVLAELGKIALFSDRDEAVAWLSESDPAPQPHR